LAAPRVRITPQLVAQLQANGRDPGQLLSDFEAWKAGREDDSYIFGHDSLGIGSKYLYHTHMVPLNDQVALDLWDKVWERGRGRRTSDRYLLYAYGGPREGYLLIAVIDDPGAHELWAPKNNGQRAALEEVAEDFCVFGSIPKGSEVP